MVDFFDPQVVVGALLSIGAAWFTLYILIKTQVLFSVIDPIILNLFQIIFTVFLLAFLKLLPTWQAAYFLIFILFLIYFNKLEIPRIKLFPVRTWLEFSNFYFFIIIIINVYLIYNKGFIWAAEDFSIAKTEYYQNSGLIKRLNDIGIITLGVSSIYYYKFNKLKAAVFLVTTLYLIFSLGSKSGILTFVFLYGAYIVYNKPLFTSKAVKISLIVLFIASSFLTFLLMFGDNGFAAFAFRFIGYADGPIYYYAGGLAGKIHRPPYYVFEQLMINARIISKQITEGLGQTINYEVFGIDNPLVGPNPQMLIEGEVMYGKFSIFYCLSLALITVIGRKVASNAYSFSFLCFFIGPLFGDSQYAFNNFFTLLILTFIFLIYNLSIKLILDGKKNYILRVQ